MKRVSFGYSFPFFYLFLPFFPLCRILWPEAWGFILPRTSFHTHVELGKLEEKVNRIVQDMALKERKEREREKHLEIEQEDSQ